MAPDGVAASAEGSRLLAEDALRRLKKQWEKERRREGQGERCIFHSDAGSGECIAEDAFGR